MVAVTGYPVAMTLYGPLGDVPVNMGVGAVPVPV